MTNHEILKGKRAAYYTLGCKLNFAETSSLGEELAACGVTTARGDDEADICIINTCSVTEVADHKGRQAISKMVRRHPSALVVVIGCYAQLQPQRIATVPGVHIVVGAEDKGRTVDFIAQAFARAGASNESSGFEATGSAWQGFEPDIHTTRLQDIRSFAPSCSCGNRTRYFLKVQDGCDYYCTYCTIPFARGRSRNGSIDSMVAQARRVAESGGKEIVITGVNIGDFGKTTGESFLDLIQALDGVEGIERYRISSIEPNLLTDDVLQFCAQSRAFMPHFHIPLQSGSDEVLRLMHRRYDTQLFADKVARVHQLMPDAFIGVDVIVGTRGETAQLFDEAERFIEALDISQLHVFSYSERPGTMALKIPHVVSPDEKHERSQRLLAISDRKLRAFYRRFVGREMLVLWEHSDKKAFDSQELKNSFHGFTPNYIRVQTTSAGPLDNTITSIVLDETNLDYNT